ncbi:uncharacterized protein LOC112466558 [Temnothorax curvispinosus]|uniref:Uncharacterized protein LOC112466558 n=1 Tax=Temnothorax curvispinosus TaxID=300111 RepID=A0A6J1R628_9HYME|nr:uncharacterized protein LOC112466558 [Temnothorax curvispinosus]
MTIYDIPGIVTKALLLAVTHQNIVSGFECTGISLFNPDIFQEYKFLLSSVTDRENPSTSAGPEEANLNAADPGTSVEPDAADPDTSAEPDAAEQNKNEFDFTDSSMLRRDDTRNLRATLESIRAFPKAAPRQTTRKGRKRRTTVVFTDSPQMKELATEQAESKQKKDEKSATRKRTTKLTITTTPRKRGRRSGNGRFCKKNATQSEPQPSTSSGRKTKSRKLNNMSCVCSDMIENRADEKQCIRAGVRHTTSACARQTLSLNVLIVSMILIAKKKIDFLDEIIVLLKNIE